MIRRPHRERCRRPSGLRPTRRARRPLFGRQRGARRDLGSVTVEVAILFPLLIVITLGGIQMAMWFHARDLCQAAAQAGVRAARAEGAPPGSGSRAATDYMTRTGAGSVDSPSVDENGSTATAVRVHVRGTVPSLVPLPGISFTIDQSASAGRERFTTPAGGAP